MQIEAVSPLEYDRFFSEALCFQRATFNDLNQQACDKPLYLIFRDKKVRLGLIAGIRDKHLFSPFSAPFGGFTTSDPKIQPPYIEESLEAFDAFCVENGFRSLTLTLPPLFYDPSFLTKLIEVLNRQSWTMSQLDLNYYYDFTRIKPDGLLEAYTYSARKNLKTAQKQPFTMDMAHGTALLPEAYTLIKANRYARGYDLKLTQADFEKTAAVVPIDCFVVRLEQVPVASAIVYQVSSTVYQVVYWGDLPDFTSRRTMNYLAYELAQYYIGQGLQYLDIGTSMIQHRPNYGLCAFKESIGNQINPKYTFYKEWRQ